MQQRNALFVSLFMFFAADVHAAGLGGSWSGNVTQNDPPQTYPMEMQLFGNKGNINYPSLGCGGNLQFIRTEGKSFFYSERLTYGKDKCIDGGTIQIGPHPFGPNQWNWTWTGSGVNVRGVVNGSGAAE